MVQLVKKMNKKLSYNYYELDIFPDLLTGEKLCLFTISVKTATNLVALIENLPLIMVLALARQNGGKRSFSFREKGLGTSECVN